VRELGQWAPSRWKDGKIHLYNLHLRKYCWMAMCFFLGSYKAGLVMAEANRDMDEQKSKDEMRRQGILSIGENDALTLLREARRR